MTETQEIETNVAKPQAEQDAAVETQKTSSRSEQSSEIYKISIFRQIVFWIMFLMFLPFFVSMPVMIMMRTTHGQTTDALALAGIFVLAILAMGFIILQISAMGRMRVELHEDQMNFVIPTWRGPTPFGPVMEKQIPYNEIADIEQRGELYKFWGALGLRQASSITTHKGDRYVLGYVTENDADEAIPFEKISKSLSQRLDKPIAHKGCVDAGTQLGAMFRGTPEWDVEPLVQQDVETIRKRSQRAAKLMIAGFFALLIGVIGYSSYPAVLKLITANAGL